MVRYVRMNNKKKQSYIGSVLFYKHMILGSILIITVGSLVLAAFFCVKNLRISDESRHYQRELEAMQKEKEENALKEEAYAMQVAASNENGIGLKTVSKDQDWKLFLVNESHPISKDYEVDLVSVSGGQQVDRRIKEPLEKMFEAMKKDGMDPIVCSGYRTIKKQVELFEECMQKKLKKGMNYEDAFFETKQRQATPGSSEHHTGLAVDIVGRSHQSLDKKQQNTKEAKWLLEHCAEYGFILRYPEDKIDITGVEYESWHFRYVGEEAARYIMDNEITLEEYLME